MAKNDKYTTEQVVAALRKTRGMVYLAADDLRCTPKTVYNYIHRYASIAAVLEHEDGRVDDPAELGLASAILRGEPWAITFRLKTKGKNRGYVERQEVTGAEGDALVVRIVRGDAKTDNALPDAV